AGKKLDDLEVGGTFDLFKPCIFTVRIDSEGSGGAADTFAWGLFESADNPQGTAKLPPSSSKFGETPHQRVAITGDWQTLAHGVQVRFGSKTGHNKGSTWYSTYDGPVAYGIRVGHGRQPDTIANVRITGRGTIDMNATRNVQPGFLVKDINACVLIHGRVRGVLVEGITMTDTNRSVMCYGEHTGKFLPGGNTGPGESFDAEDITIQRTRTINPNGAAYLLGHPSFRGHLRNVKCNYNYMETGVTSIEPNFNLDGYEVIGNVIDCGGLYGAIHCWRRSRNGFVMDNLRINDIKGREVVGMGSPRGWESPEPPLRRNNRNLLSDAVPVPAPQVATFGRRLLVSDYNGNKVAIVAADGRIEWEHPAEKPQDSWLLPNGNVLFSHVKGAKEVKPDHSVAWEYVADAKTEIQGCQPLPDGRVLVVECGPGRLLEIGRDGKIAKEIKVPLTPTIKTHEQMRGCRKTADGRYLVSAKGDRAVLELSGDGKLLRKQPVNGDVHDVRELANGNWLVALGEGDGVVEYDKSGKAVWNIGPNEVTDNPLYLASSVERLANGNTIVMNWLGHGHLGATAQIFEVDAQKKLIRQFTDHRQFTSINHIQVLE
ncbi:MAG: PQQ-binding-like beta-propeller repeat protein, partial [Verrucomicrobiota bacterium]